MTASASTSQPSAPFAGWPSSDYKGVLQLREPLAKVRTRARPATGGVAPAIRSDDDHDGLGPYSSFHFKDNEIGYVAFVSHDKAPSKGTDVIVDAEAPVGEAVVRLRQLLDLKAADIRWVHPDARQETAAARKKASVSSTTRARKATAATVSLSAVAAELAAKRGITRKQADAALDGFIGLVVKHLKKKDTVRIAGLGIFQVKKRPARMERNPATGAAIRIKASRKVAFRAAKDLEESI